MFGNVQRLAAGPIGRTGQLAAALLGSAVLSVGLYVGAVLQAVPRSDLPSSYKWLLLQDVTQAPRIIIEGGSSGHHGIDTDLLSQALGVTAINVADNAGYDLTDKIARLERFARPGDTVVLQLEWSYYLRDSVTDDYLSVLFGALPDYLTTMPLPDQVRRALTVPAPVLWSALHPEPPEPPVLTPAQALDVAALQGSSGHVSYATPRALAAGVEGQSCDSYLFSSALAKGGLELSPLFLAALDRARGLRDRGVQVLFAWPIVVGDDCYTSDIGLADLQGRVQQAVTAAGFSFLGAMSDTLFPTTLRDDTPYHLITAGAERRTLGLIAALRAQGVTGAGALDLMTLTRADILTREAQVPDPATLTPLPPETALAVTGAPDTQLHLAAGWWQAEDSGRWMRGKEAVLTLALDEGLPEGRILTLAGFTFNDQPRRLAVFHDGRDLGQAVVQGAFTLPIITTGLPRGRPLRLTLRLLDDEPLQSPASLGQGDDVRTLTVHMQNLSLVPPADPVALAVAAIPQPTPACVPEDATLCQSPPLLTADQPPADLTQPLRIAFTEAPLPPQVQLTGGWWGPEAGGRWIGAQDAAITLRPFAAQGATGVRISAIPFHADTLAVQITAAGRVVFEGDMRGDQPISLTLPADLAGQAVTLVLHFPTVTPQCPQSLGLANDARSLLAFVTAVETFAAGSGL